MTVEVRLLGPVEVAADGRAVPLRAPRERALVALLALQDGRPLSVEAAVDGLWGPDPPPTARNAVQVYVSHLRQALGQNAISRENGGYRLEADTDVVRFQDLARAGHEALTAGTADLARELLESALQSFPGPALDACGDAVFAPTAAARLEEARLSAVEDLSAARLDLPDADGVPDLRRLVAEHPFRERLWAMLIRALYKAGRRADALAAYAEARTVLADELGIEPGPELAAIHHAVLHDHGSLAAPSRERRAWSVTPPPSRLTSLVGRELELGEVMALATDDRIRLITLVGPGGVGKTSLATEASRRVADSFDDGVCWVPLAGLSRDAEVLPAIAGALSLHDTGASDLAARVVATLRDRQLLMVLDNTEHVVGGCVPAVLALLQGTTSVTILCTSRVALRITGEHRFTVRPLPVLGAANEPGSAVALFVERARAITARFEPDLDEVRALCARLDGLPLAIEIAASRTNLLSTGELLEQLDDRLSLASVAPETPDRHRSLRAVLGWSHALLAETQRDLLSRLSAFRAGFTIEGAIAVSPQDRAETLQALDALAEASLVTRRPDDGRLGMLETVRQFAAEDLVVRGGIREAQDQHARHVAEVVRRLWRSTPPLRRPRTLADVEVLEAERQNLLAAINHARTNDDHATFADLVICTAGWWRDQAPSGELVRWLDELLDRPLSATRRVDALCWRLRLGNDLQVPYPSSHQGWREARRLLAAAPDLARQAHVEVSEAIATAGSAAGRDVDTASVAASAVDAAERSGDLATMAVVYAMAGAVLAASDVERAQSLLERATRTSRQIGDLATEAVAGLNLSELLLTRGDGEAAARVAEQALACATTMNATLLRSYLQINLGGALLLLGADDRAEAHLCDAVRQADWSHDASFLAEASMSFAALAALRHQDRRAGALSAAHRSLVSQLRIEPPGSTRVTATLAQPAVDRLGSAAGSVAALGAALTPDTVVAALLDRDWPPDDRDG
ncbi:MAG TPA: BTAD domain-containing putative transcriptional regulator [Actinomycetales bacterium]|nr:BTAD domain-containing putative transcriptional regulator [Actinomycetales bacterium]